MSKLLELPRGLNSLIAAYEAIRDASTPAQNDIAKLYEQHFVTAVPPSNVRAPDFERVSLIDPNIRTFVRANT